MLALTLEWAALVVLSVGCGVLFVIAMREGKRAEEASRESE